MLIITVLGQCYLLLHWGNVIYYCIRAILLYDCNGPILLYCIGAILLYCIGVILLYCIGAMLIIIALGQCYLLLHWGNITVLH